MMIEQLIHEIYDTTLEIEKALGDRNIEEVERLVENRQTLMIKVETMKAVTLDFEYPPSLKNTLKAAFLLDQQLLPNMEELKQELGQELGEVKKKRQVSQKYSPYHKQHYGAFIDTNK